MVRLLLDFDASIDIPSLTGEYPHHHDSKRSFRDFENVGGERSRSESG